MNPTISIAVNPVSCSASGKYFTGLFQKIKTKKFVLFFLIESAQYVLIAAVDENIENVAGTSALEGQNELISSKSLEMTVVTVDHILAVENQSTATSDSFNDDPSEWEINETTCYYWAAHGLPKRKYNFSNSKKTYVEKEGKIVHRFCKTSMFQPKLPR